jgi:Trypsin
MTALRARPRPLLGLGWAVTSVAVLLALPSQAYGISGGAEAADGTYGFVARVDVGGERGCSGVLVDPQWIATAASCFAENGQPVPPGLPAKATTVTVGRANLLSGTDGQVRTVIELVPREDRDLVLLRITTPISDIAPAKVRATPPAAGDVVRVAGYGRTEADWVPGRMHTGTFAVQAVAGTAVTIAGQAGSSAAVCKGDAGGPAFRETASGAELVGLNSTSWQAGCLAETETRQGATEVRLDDIASWIAQTIRGGNFVRLPTATHVLDTRSGLGAPTGALGAGGTKSFPVAGVGGVPKSGVTAVLIDVTAVNTTAGAFLTVWPTGGPRPNASMVNTAKSQTISNSAVVEVPDNGNLTVFNSAGTTHVVVDVQGYFTRTPGTGSGFVAVPHTRVVDTRSGIGGSTGEIAAGQSRVFTLTGGVVPAGGSDGSVMDFAVGTTSTGITAKLGSDGKATFTNHSGSPIHLVLTAEGYFTSSATTGATFRGLPVARLLDTRSGGGAPVPANGTLDLPLRLPPGATAGAVLNLTIVNNTSTGFLHVWPSGGTEVSPSLVDYPAANTSARSSLAVVPAGADGKVRIKNVSSGTVHVLVDVQGWFAAPTAVVGTPGTTQTVGAAADETMPSIVETWDHPGAAQILAQYGLKLFKGDGHVLFVTARPIADGVQCDAGQVQVEVASAAPPFGMYYCFRTVGTQGFLKLEVPGTFLVRGGDRAMRATVDPPDGAEQTTFDVPPNTPVSIYPGDGSELPQAVLLELRIA